MAEAASPPGDTGQYVTLRVYLEDRIDGLEKLIDTRLEANATAVAAALRANQIAIDKAEATVNDRLAMMNEFRAAMKDQAGQYVTMATLEAREATRIAETKAIWKFLYSLGVSLATLQAVVAFLQAR